MNFEAAGQAFVASAMRSVGATAQARHYRDDSGGMHIEDSSGDAATALIVSDGVLQYLDENDVVPELRRLLQVSRFAILRIHTRFSSGLPVAGRNAFASVHTAGWWLERIESVFGAACRLQGTPREFCIVLSWNAAPELLGRAHDLRAAVSRDHHRARRLARLQGMFWRLVRRPLDEAALLAGLQGRCVALVGNAKSLEKRAYGAAIDAADVVVRCNRGIIVTTQSHGSRTDWICTGLPVSRQYADRRHLLRVVWASRRPKMMRNIPAWMYASGRLHLFSARRDAVLKRRLGRVASTGMKAIDLLAASDCARLDIFGFDFAASDSASQPTRPMSIDHDFGQERALALEMIARDERIHLHE